MKRYAVKEVFYSVQGEGRHAGVPSVFVRFAGCNLWSGSDATRERDATRNEAECPKWCDTSFVFGELLTAEEILEAMRAELTACGADSARHVVLTGGEPLIHITPPLLAAIAAAFVCPVAVETNGSRTPPPEVAALIDWVTVSPKQAPDKIKLRHGDELKVVWPGSPASPAEYRAALGSFDHYYVSPLAETTAVGVSLLDRDNMRQAFDYVRTVPGWALSLQTHKIVGAR